MDRLALLYCVYKAINKFKRKASRQYLRCEFVEARTKLLTVRAASDTQVLIECYPVVMEANQPRAELISARYSWVVTQAPAEIVNKHLNTELFAHWMETVFIRVRYFLKRLADKHRRKNHPSPVQYQLTQVGVRIGSLRHTYQVLVRWDHNPYDPSTSFERVDQGVCHPFLNLVFRWEGVGISQP